MVWLVEDNLIGGCTAQVGSIEPQVLLAAAMRWLMPWNA